MLTQMDSRVQSAIQLTRQLRQLDERITQSTNYLAKVCVYYIIREYSYEQLLGDRHGDLDESRPPGLSQATRA